jgi:hypothetical protein
LGHPEINCLARIANIEIIIHTEAYESATGCKIIYAYNPSASRGNITVFRSVEGSVAKVSSIINKEAKIVHPIAMMTRHATVMAVTKGA